MVFLSSIFVVTIALVACTLIFIVSFIIPRINNDSIIRLQLTPINIGKDLGTKIQVNNNGGIKVTNLNMTIHSPKEISNYSNFSTVDLTIKKINPRTLKVHAPVFIYGDGSIILMNILFKNAIPIDYNRVSVYAVYDQGSTKGVFQSSNFWDQGIYTFYHLSTIERVGTVTIGFIALLSISFIILNKYYNEIKNFFNKNRATLR